MWWLFFSCLHTNHPRNTIFLTQLLDQLESVNNGPIETSAAVALEADASKKILQLFDTHLPHIWQGAHGYLSAFRLLYLDIVDIVFGMVRAAREENLVIHLQSIYIIIPCVYAYDAVNYAQYLSYCTVTMSKRVGSHLGLSAEFWQRRFSVQMGPCDPFAKIPADRSR